MIGTLPLHCTRFSGIIIWITWTIIQNSYTLKTLKILPVTPILVLAITGYMAAAVAFVTVGFPIAGATATAAATASSATSAERCAVDGSSFTAIPGKMSGSVAPIAHYSTTHD